MLAGICVSVFLGRAVEINVLVFGWSRELSSHHGRGCFSGNVIPASSLLLPARRGGGEGGEGGGQAGQRQPETLNFYGSKRDNWPVLWGSRRSRKAGKSQRKGLLQAAGHMNRGLGHFEPRLCFSHCALSVLIDFNCFLQHLSSLTRGQIWPEPRMKLQQIIFEF